MVPEEVRELSPGPSAELGKVQVGERRLDVAELRQICQALRVDKTEVILKWEVRLDASLGDCRPERQVLRGDASWASRMSAAAVR